MKNRHPHLESIERAFDLDTAGIGKIVRGFRSEMRLGLAGGASSLKMIPTYVSRPTGREKGVYFALDLGGTNFRILRLTLEGGGRSLPPKVMKFALQKRHISGSGDDLFDFIAACIEKFIRTYRLPDDQKHALGFTFSFPVRQTGIAAGTLVCWTKDFSARGVVGRDVVACLRRALARRGLGNIEIAALANDTVGTLVAASYADPSCDVGVIIGTGTNACYPERLRAIRKWRGASGGGEMIVNIEWGNFNKLAMTAYDILLDRSSDNPGEQILEKMVSGMYLGEVARLAIAGLAARGGLPAEYARALAQKGSFKTAYMSDIERDRAPRFAATARVLGGLGVRSSTPEGRRSVRDICAAVSRRGARIAASAILGVVIKIDPAVSRLHTIALDGSVYEKHPTFALHMQEAFRDYLGRRASRIRLFLAKDGSGKGAAIIAAVAYAGKDTAGRRR